MSSDSSSYITVFGSNLSPNVERLDEIFDLYCLAAKKMTEVANSDLAILYGNFKQAKFGNNTSEKPWFYEMVASEKWQAWTACQDKRPDLSMFDYIVKADQLLIRQFGVEETRRIIKDLAQNNA